MLNVYVNINYYFNASMLNNSISFLKQNGFYKNTMQQNKISISNKYCLHSNSQIMMKKCTVSIILLLRSTTVFKAYNNLKKYVSWASNQQIIVISEASLCGQKSASKDVYKQNFHLKMCLETLFV